MAELCLRSIAQEEGCPGRVPHSAAAQRTHSSAPPHPAPWSASCGPLRGPPWPASSRGSSWDGSGQGSAPLGEQPGHRSRALHCLPGRCSGLGSFKENYVFPFGCAGSSLLQGSLLWQSRGSGAHQPQLSWFPGSRAQARGLSCSAVCGIFPDQGWNPCLLHCQAASSALGHPEALFLRFSVHIFTLPEAYTLKPCAPPTAAPSKAGCLIRSSSDPWLGGLTAP